MTAVRAPESVGRPLAGERPRTHEWPPRIAQDSARFDQDGPLPGWTAIKIPKGATFESLALGDPRLAEKIRERSVGRPEWTEQVKARPDGPLGWLLGLFGVPATKPAPRYALGDKLPEGATLLVPRELDPTAAAPPGFRRVALPAGHYRLADLTGLDAAWAEAVGRANPDLAPDRLARGALHVNLPEDLPIEKGLPAPHDASKQAPAEQIAKLAKHLAYEGVTRTLDAARGILEIKPGDTLASLANLVLGDATRWTDLAPRRDPDVGAGDDLAGRGLTYIQLPEAYFAPDWGDVEPLDPEHPFLKQLARAAARIEKKHGIPAEVILAQAALESRMGSSRIGEYNVFGIKGSGSKGSYLVPTFEYRGGQKIQTQAHFANFGSWDEALQAHAEIFEKPAFAKAMSHKDDPVAFAHALTGKYATDPRYGDKLVQTMREQGLLGD